MADKKMITKDDLAQRIATEVRLTKGDATKAVEVLFAAIAQGITDPDFDGVKIAGFGQFLLVDRPARMGVNPSKKDDKIEIPASKAVKFKPSKTLKDLVNNK